MARAFSSTHLSAALLRQAAWAEISALTICSPIDVKA